MEWSFHYLFIRIYLGKRYWKVLFQSTFLLFSRSSAFAFGRFFRRFRLCSRCENDQFHSFSLAFDLTQKTSSDNIRCWTKNDTYLITLSTMIRFFHQTIKISMKTFRTVSRATKFTHISLECCSLAWWSINWAEVFRLTESKLKQPHRHMLMKSSS